MVFDAETMHYNMQYAISLRKMDSEMERQTKRLRIVHSVRALFTVDLRRSKTPALPTQPSKVWLLEASLIGLYSEECVCESEADRNRGSLIKSRIGTTWRDHKWSLRHRLETQEEEVALFQPQTRHHKHPSYPSRWGSTSRTNIHPTSLISSPRHVQICNFTN